MSEIDFLADHDVNVVEPEPVITLNDKLEDASLFTDDDADKKGWICYRERLNDKGDIREHHVPVKYWPVYEARHNF